MICPVCFSSSVEFFHTFQKMGYTFSVFSCKDCGSYFQKDPPKEEGLYQEGYYTGEKEYSYQDERKTFFRNQIVYKARIKNLLKYVSSRKKFLDVGCALGGFPLVASKYFQEAGGLEISPFAVKEGNQFIKSLHPPPSFQGIFLGSLIHLPSHPFFEKESFSVISMVEVIEHLTSPREHIKSAYHLLEKGGILLIQTANFEGWQAIKEGKNYHYFLPGHVVYYTASALKKMLKEIGFSFFKEFIPVDFPLWAKWLKARKRLLSITYYHLKSYIRYKGRPLTSSYVLYAFK